MLERFSVRRGKKAGAEAFNELHLLISNTSSSVLSTLISATIGVDPALGTGDVADRTPLLFVHVVTQLEVEGEPLCCFRCNSFSTARSAVDVGSGISEPAAAPRGT